MFTIEQLTFNDIIHNIVTNDYFILLGSFIGFIGFCMTIHVTIKTKSIDEKLNNYKLIEQFNAEHGEYAKIFRTYRVSITDDGVEINKIKHDILEQLEKFKSKYHPIIGYKLKLHIYFFCQTLKKEKEISKSKVCNYLVKLSGILSNNKENPL